MDSEYNAIQTGYSVLSGLVGSELANAYIRNYEQDARQGADRRAVQLPVSLQSGRITQEQYDKYAWTTGRFVQDPDGGRFGSVWNAVDAYRARLSASITEQRSFPEKLVKNWDGNAAKYFSEHPDVYEKFRATEYGFQQSCMLVNIEYECGGFDYVLRQKELSSLKYEEKQTAKLERINMAFAKHGLDLSDETILYGDGKMASRQAEMAGDVIKTVEKQTLHDSLRIKASMPAVKEAYKKACEDAGIDDP